MLTSGTQLLGITRGLNYLHSNEVVHGDLKGVSGAFNRSIVAADILGFLQPNVLIDVQGNPLLADFGLSSITKNVTSVNASTPHGGATIRWAAPELLDAISHTGRKQRHTAESDIYALSMVVIEVGDSKPPQPKRSRLGPIFSYLRGGCRTPIGWMRVSFSW